MATDEIVLDMIREGMREIRTRLDVLDGRVTKITDIVSELSVQLDNNNKKTDSLDIQVNKIQDFVSCSKGGKATYTWLVSVVSVLTAVAALIIAL
jgi:hypothetical protein